MAIDNKVKLLKEITKCRDCNSISIGTDRYDWISKAESRPLYDAFLEKVREEKLRLLQGYCPVHKPRE